MEAWCLKIVFPVLIILLFKGCKAQNNQVTTWTRGFHMPLSPSTPINFKFSEGRTLEKMVESYFSDDSEEGEDDAELKDLEEDELGYEDENLSSLEEEARKKYKKNKKYKKFKKKKYKKFLIPLLVAYKLKFFTLIPILIGGLVLLTGATGLAGFFFALFAATMGLKTGEHHH